MGGMGIMSLDHALHPDQQLRWLYIDFNSYFASVEQQLDPRLRGRPVAVVPVDTDATCAIAASYEAKAFGIKTGTPVYEAKAKCPGLVCVLARHEKYVDYHHRILRELDRHLPVSEVCSIDEMACRLMRNEQSLQRVEAIAGSIKRGLAANVGEYVTCSIGVASNKYLAKVATDLKKPNGFTVLPPGCEKEMLAGLALRDLPGIGRSMERRLYLAGVYDMQDLWALDARRMRKIWGSVWGEKMYYLLRGMDMSDETTTRSTVGHSHVMAPALREPARARQVARRLTLKAASRLRRMGYYASEFYLAARFENGPRLEDHEHCYRAQDSFTFLRLLDTAWAKIMREARGQRVRKVSVVLHGLTPVSGLQPELLPSLSGDEQHAREKAERVSRALDRINHRFGRDAVCVGMLPSQGRGFSGTKVAFTRIPDVEEFLE